eukprot:INCI16421.1.p1 GENE.INCI16421.1~~INCI16421.1.p1  ORF type:complete len:279 (+),score=47.30 INCI16421.1:243-1079(+)
MASSRGTAAAAAAAGTVRLNKLMSQLGLCSRREADKYIAERSIQVFGETATLGQKVPADLQASDIEILRKAVRHQNEKMTFMLHKPRSFISQTSDKLRPSQRLAVQLLEMHNQDRTARHQYRGKTPPRYMKKLACAGRLDADSSGLLLFTQDGRLANQVIGANSPVHKEYIVQLSDSISRQEQRTGIARRLRHGIELDGVLLKEADVEWLHHDTLRFVLQEGRYRQIRRMCASLDLDVARLHRTRIGNLHLEDLPVGCWRTVEPKEIMTWPSAGAQEA